MPTQMNPIPVEISLFRKSLALVQIGYYLSLLPRFKEFFGVRGWVNADYVEDVGSLLLLFDSNLWRYLLLALIFALLIMLYQGRLNRIGLFIFYIVNLAFYQWNPLIIHEPQPLTNLFFLSLFFLPLTEKDKYDAWIKNILIVFLGIYYFIAGVKKLPDLNFLKGVALEEIISWSVMAKSMDVNLFLIKYFKWPMRAMNYLTLIFEMTFIFFVFTRYRVYLILFGVLLHSLIYLTLEVGNFSFVMMVWYTLLIDEELKNNFKILIETFRRKFAKD